MEPISYHWILKRTTVGAPQWTLAVVQFPTCPDQRRYRRLNRTERLQFFRDKNT
jgi:hypothetical protein